MFNRVAQREFVTAHNIMTKHPSWSAAMLATIFASFIPVMHYFLQKIAKNHHKSHFFFSTNLHKCKISRNFAAANRFCSHS